MRLQRLFQPRNPVFWLMMALNALSLALGWVVQTYALNALGVAVVVVFGLGNALLGMWLAWQLVRDPPSTPGPGA